MNDDQTGSFTQSVQLLKAFADSNEGAKDVAPETYSLVIVLDLIASRTTDYNDFCNLVRLEPEYAQWKVAWEKRRQSLERGVTAPEYVSQNDYTMMVQVSSAMDYSMDDLLNNERDGYIACRVNLSS